MSFNPVPTAEQEKVLVIAINDDRYLLSHRFDVAKAAVDAGWRVIVAAGENGCRRQIEDAGMEYYPLPIYGTGMSLRLQLQTLPRLVALFKKHPGAVVHLVGMKMLLVGNMAARLSGGMKGIINAVCGLGILFQNPHHWKPRLMLRLMRYTLLNDSVHPALESSDGRKVTIIVQNRDDETLLRASGVIGSRRVEYIKGAGVNLDRYRPADLSSLLQPLGPDNRINLIFSGRLLRSKGIFDLFKAAELLKKDWKDKIRFTICGDVCSNQDSLSREEMIKACDGDYITWKGHCNDMSTHLAESHIMVFPSYYREGVPLSVIEASAAGLPIITCDNVGCRDTIDGNGVLVPPRNPQALARAIESLLRNPRLCLTYGDRSRQLAERDYDIRHVIERHLQIYDSLLGAD